MTSLWIVHREEAPRRALARLAAAGAESVAGGPSDPVFDTGSAPEVVLLGLAGNLEAELEFAHRQSRRLPGAGWVLVGDGAVLERARRLFDRLPAHFLAWPPEVAALRGALRTAAIRREPEPLPLSQRPLRDAVAERFARAFGDLELPELLRALDPRLAAVPVLILGERGSGRGTLARYLHHFGGTAGGALVELRCGPETRAADLRERLAACRGIPRCRQACLLWLAEPERLAPALQDELAGWIELAPPEETLASPTLRWVSTSRGVGLEASLRRAAGGLSIQIPPLRERPDLIVPLATETARSWCGARGVPARRLAEDALAILEEYPWPGNLRELEAVVEQSLAASAADPLGADDLVLDGEPFAPLGGRARGARPAPRREAPVAAERAEPEVEEEVVSALPVEEADFLLEGLEPLEEEGEEEAEGAEAPEPRPQPAPAPPAPRSTAAAPGDLARLAAALGHEVRNPLTSVRVFAELLPERYRDPEFRSEFARLAAEGLSRAEGALARLERLAAFAPPQPRPVDVAGLLEDLLDKRRSRIHERRLLVLEELDRGRPTAFCDPEQLRFACEGLLDAAIELVPERGHIYLASKRTAPGVRVLLRWRGPESAPERAPHPQISPAANALDLALAEIAVRAQGGALTLDTSDRSETLVVVDLPS
jgi:DNA-binding NtrC family response regulator